MTNDVGPQPPLWRRCAIIAFLIASLAALCIALSLPH
jgi:hypothetical protein